MTKMYVDPQSRLKPIPSYISASSAEWLAYCTNLAVLGKDMSGGTGNMLPAAGTQVQVRAENSSNQDYLLALAAAGTPTTANASRFYISQDINGIDTGASPHKEVIFGARIRRGASGVSAPLASCFYGSASIYYAPATAERDVYVEIVYDVLLKKITTYYNSELVATSTLVVPSGATSIILYIGSNPRSDGLYSAMVNGDTLYISSIVGIFNENAGDMAKLGPVYCQRAQNTFTNPAGDWVDTSAVVASLGKRFENTASGLSPLITPVKLNTSPSGGTVDLPTLPLPDGYELIGFATSTSAQRVNPASPVNLSFSMDVDGVPVGKAVSSPIKTASTHMPTNLALLETPIKAGDTYPTKCTVKFVGSK